jgi:hypothetical protein
MINVGIFYDSFETFMAIKYNLWPFGIVCGHLLYFSLFGMFGPKKNLATLVPSNLISKRLLCRARINEWLSSAIGNVDSF